MTPKDYLTSRGKAYFNEIAAILGGRKMDDDAFSIELSRLANELDKYETAHEKALIREAAGLPGFYNEAANHTVQVNAFHTMQKDAQAMIDKLSVKFGLTPKDLGLIKPSKKSEEKTDPIGEFKKGNKKQK